LQNSASVAVIGAGHAGVEAALACARLGLDTVLFTINLDSVANMPCNPSIGGTAKGHLVFEIDALGGEMGVAADSVTLQSRTLNLGKGAAVHSKRVQADRWLYSRHIKRVLEDTPNLRLIQAQIVDICVKDADGKQKVCGVITNLGEKWNVDAAVICSGTYLDSAIFIGENRTESGPDGLMPAKGLSSSLEKLGVELRRFKTGTPPRVLASSIDFSQLEEQKGEEYITPYSVLTDAEKLNKTKQLSCHIVYTNEQTHRIIRENLSRSAMYGGKIHGTGPRYCPSIEDKVVRFADKSRHQLFVEPMGLDTDEMYIQGFSTSMPVDVQYQMLRSLKGFENAQIMRYAYAIEYDCADPTQLAATLEFKNIDSLYGAGQFNGTSGYEEAAAQGLLAGINAAMKILGREQIILKRSESYIGTLVDDLVTKGTNEPYRMMTSRSEYRLLLRQDNADRRLTPIGYEVGLISQARYAAFLEKQKRISDEIERAKKTVLPPSRDVNECLSAHGSAVITTGEKLADLLRRPELDYKAFEGLDKTRVESDRQILESAQIEIKYEGYIKRELAEVERTRRLDDKKLPCDIDYMSVRGLRTEAAQKLQKFKPLSIGQASRISGVNPADISVLLIWLSTGRDKSEE
jgi:tRNA uridine 5-carboxymethylaminomethyl modification enzyme